MVIQKRDIYSGVTTPYPYVKTSPLTLGPEMGKDSADLRDTAQALSGAAVRAWVLLGDKTRRQTGGWEGGRGGRLAGRERS